MGPLLQWQYCVHVELTLAVVIWIGDLSERILGLVLRDGNHIIPSRILRQRSRILPVKFLLERSHILPSPLLVLDILFRDGVTSFLARKLSPREKLLMQDIQRRQPGLLQQSGVKVRKLIRVQLPSAPVFAPVVRFTAQAAGRQGFSGDLLPELTLCFGREGNLVVRDGGDEVGVRVRLALCGRETCEAGVGSALGEDVCLVESLP
jgi:hypothetical protein